MVLRKPSRKVQEINIQGSELIAVKTVAQMKALEDLEDKQRILVYDPLKKDPPVEYVWINSEFLKVTGSGISTPGGGTGEGGGTTIITTQTIVVPTLAERDALQDLKMDDRVIVLDASADENVSGKVAEYLYRGKEWVLLSKQGKDGLDGADGADGKDGSPGQDGATGSKATIIDNVNQLALLEGEDGDKAYVRDDEVEYIFVDGAWKKLTNGTGGEGGVFTVRAEDVEVSDNLQFISKTQKELIKTHDRLIEELKKEVAAIEINPPSDGKVKMSSGDNLTFLDQKLGETLQVKGSVIEVVKLLGQLATVKEVNELQGIRQNVQAQIDALSRFGNFTGSVDNKAALLALPTPTLNDMVIVLEDETQNDESTIYMHDGVQWIFAGKFSIKMRDFLVDKIDINNETKGMLKKERYTLPIAKDIVVEDADKKFPVTKNVEAALAYLAENLAVAEEEIEVMKAKEELAIQVVQVKERRFLPAKGKEGTMYIVEADETNEDKKTLYIWATDIKGQGNYELIIASSVSGVMQEYQQVTKLSVVAPRTYEMPIPRTQNFLRAPIEVLSFSKGKQNVKVDAAFNNKSSDDFHRNPEYVFTDKGFTLSDTLEFEGVKVKDCEDGIIQEIDLAGVHIGKKITEVF